MTNRAFVSFQVKNRISRHGKKHDIYVNPKNGQKAPIPRHRELENSICDLIYEQLGLK